MNVQKRKSVRRRGQALVRTVLALGMLFAGAAAYLVTDTSRAEWIILTGLVTGLVVLGTEFYTRARNRREWSAAWDAYASREVGRASARRPVAEESVSWAGMN